jgi:hypothetical protein
MSFAKTNTVTSHTILEADARICHLDVSDVAALGDA